MFFGQDDKYIYFLVTFVYLTQASNVQNLKKIRKPFPDRTDEEFLAECMSFHNEVRKKHNTPELKIDHKLVLYAKQRLLNMTQYDRLTYQHTDLDDDTGENIYRGVARPERLRCKNAIKAWYTEIKFYDFAKGQFNQKASHFTQVIWADTKNIGCARSVIKANGTKEEAYIVCNYKEPGNMKGEFLKNVKKAKDTIAILTEQFDSLFDPIGTITKQYMKQIQDMYKTYLGG